MAGLTLRRIGSLLRKSSFKEYSIRLLDLATPSIRIRTRRRRAKRGQSRFGGQPDLPDDVEWPRSDDMRLHFVCQINFAEASPFDRDGALPKDGTLYLFQKLWDYGWGYDPAHRRDWEVLYVPAGTRTKRRPFPADLEHPGEYRESIVEFETEWMIPSRGCSEFPADLESLLAKDEARDDEYRDVWNSDSTLDLGINQHRLLGIPQPNQGDMRLECELVTNGIYCGKGIPDSIARPHARRATNWRLLLQIDTDDTRRSGPGWMWGDCGRLYFMIRDGDLRRRRFDKSWLIMQCF